MDTTNHDIETVLCEMDEVIQVVSQHSQNIQRILDEHLLEDKVLIRKQTLTELTMTLLVMTKRAQTSTIAVLSLEQEKKRANWRWLGLLVCSIVSQIFISLGISHFYFNQASPRINNSPEVRSFSPDILCMGKQALSQASSVIDLATLSQNGSQIAQYESL